MKCNSCPYTFEDSCMIGDMLPCQQEYKCFVCGYSQEVEDILSKELHQKPKDMRLSIRGTFRKQPICWACAVWAAHEVTKRQPEINILGQIGMDLREWMIRPAERRCASEGAYLYKDNDQSDQWRVFDKTLSKVGVSYEVEL